MKNLLRRLLFSLLIIAQPCLATDSAKPTAMDYSKISSSDIEKMVTQFAQAGIIDKKEAERIKKELKQITPEQWLEIRKEATKMQNQTQSPNTSNDLNSALKNINTNSPEFKKIQGIMKGILKGPSVKLE